MELPVWLLQRMERTAEERFLRAGSSCLTTTPGSRSRSIAQHGFGARRRGSLEVDALHLQLEVLSTRLLRLTKRHYA